MAGAARLADPSPLPIIATEFVTFAARGGRPTASSEGYATSVVIPPAVPITPATTPAIPRNKATSTTWGTPGFYVCAARPSRPERRDSVRLQTAAVRSGGRWDHGLRPLSTTLPPAPA